jgi:release factor glutamine methyltransferase
MPPSEKFIANVLKRLSQRFLDAFSSRESKQMAKELIKKYTSYTDHDFIVNKGLYLSLLTIQKLESDQERIMNGEPFQYVIGSTFFYNAEFKIDKRALIPRPETEELVDFIIRLLKREGLEYAKVIDIGTGSGCIALSLKKELPESRVVGIDISAEAISLAKENAAALQLDVDFQCRDILTEELNQTFNIIVSNPPYIPIREKEQMENHVTRFEPNQALFVENDKPLQFYERITQIGTKLLKNGGYLAFEVHENLAKDVEKYVLLKGFTNTKIIQDLQGKDRMVIAQLVNS